MLQPLRHQITLTSLEGSTWSLKKFVFNCNVLMDFKKRHQNRSRDLKQDDVVDMTQPW